MPHSREGIELPSIFRGYYARVRGGPVSASSTNQPLRVCADASHVNLSVSREGLHDPRVAVAVADDPDAYAVEFTAQ